MLASGSSARLRLLRDAGFDPQVEVSGVDESVLADADPWEQVLGLAVAKARAVAGRCAGDALVIGCDSMLVLDGALYGKPADAVEAERRWRAMRGRTGVLLTGHCLLDVATGREATEVADTLVRFGTPTDGEITAYAKSDEATAVAGPFTIDGRAAAFVDGIDGDASNVVGLSLPLLRRLLAELGVELTSLWV